MMKRSVSVETKEMVFWRDGGRCRICKDVLGELRWQCDHRIPLFEGGGNSPSNLQALCANCHCEKTALENVRRVERVR